VYPFGVRDPRMGTTSVLSSTLFGRTRGLCFPSCMATSAKRSICANWPAVRRSLSGLCNARYDNWLMPVLWLARSLGVVGKVGLSAVVEKLADAQKILNREINPTVYSVKELRGKVDGNFLKTVLADKKLFIIGDENVLRELGLPPDILD
jgi:hypothetical protein